LLNDACLPFVEGDVDELYTEVADVQARFKFLGIIDIDNEYISYDSDDEAYRTG
jgi:hypothetical protein